MLNIYTTFFEKVSIENIPYCSWKNNHVLKDELSGNGDIDLLVQPSCKHKFERILSDYDFIRVSSSISEYPHIHHYYGYDENANKFAHMHVYYKLVTGDSHLKNYRLPLESQILESSKVNQFGISEAAAHHQMQLYILRKVIKKSSLTGIFLLIRESGDYRNEFQYISRKLTNKKVSLSLFGSNQTLQEGYSLSLKNHFYLRVFLLSWKRDVGIGGRIFQLSKRIVNKLFLKKKKSIEGSLIAIVGLDGSGKTTSVDMIHKWLSKDFNAKTFHFGRPPPTLITLPLRMALFARKKLGKAKPVGSLGNTSKELNLGTIGKVRYVALAYERSVLIKKAHQYSLKGGVSILDRYPSICVGLMDSPRIPADKLSSTFSSLLYKIESTLYKSMPIADLLFKFDVDVENALIRNRNRIKKGKETDEEIMMRFKLNNELEYRVQSSIKIDANNQIEQVHQLLRKYTWKHIVSTN